MARRVRPREKLIRLVLSQSNTGQCRFIRHRADLQDLAAVSVPYEMTTGHATQLRRVTGHQRELNEKHAQDIKKYLEQSDSRFIPEVVLSARVPVNPVDVDRGVVLETDEPPSQIIGVQNDETTTVIIKRIRPCHWNRNMTCGFC